MLFRSQKNERKNEEINRYPERIEKPVFNDFHKKPPVKNILPAQPVAHPKIFSSIKKVFTPSAPKNTGLKEVLNKALQEPAVVPTPIPTSTPISLDSLKEKMKDVKKEPINSKDRAATREDMNKLKDLIAQKVSTPAPVSTSTPVPQKPI